MKNLTIAALAIVALAAMPAKAANWSDTYLGYQWSNQFRDPGIATDETKSRIELSGVYGWDYGTNFFDVNMLAASKMDPANDPSGQPAPNVPGDTEVYVVYRSNFDLGKIFKTNMGFGPVREVDFTVGFDFDSTDNQFASNKKFMMAGPQFGFNISKGFWNLGVGGCREINYNGVVNKTDYFKTDYMVWTAWNKTFDIGIPMVWKGWANYLGPKGNNSFTNLGPVSYPDGVPTKAETLCDTYLMFDVSNVVGRKSGAIFLGLGYEYWNNKFGGRNVSFSDPLVTGPITSGDGPWNANAQVNALMFAAEFHF